MTKHLGLLTVLLAVAGTSDADPEPAATRDARHVDAILRAAKTYATWGRVDERPNIAPSLCRAPMPADYGSPAHVRMSKADDAPHGKKLYYLYASDRSRYLDTAAELPVGFTVVKQSFAALPTSDPPAREPERDDVGVTSVPPPLTTVLDDNGKRLTLGPAKDLYVMVKVGDVPGADDGWVFGTVAPDGSVTSAGRVASCMGCHDDAAKREKLFGLRAAPKP